METTKRKFQPLWFLILGLAFLWIRNAPLALTLPLWSHGDEIAHLDYIMKIGRGHLPLSDEYIESSVYYLHRVRYDARYISPYRKMRYKKLSDFRLAAYSYEAQQPPLPYLVLAAVRIPLKEAGLSLFAQVKALRIAILLVVSAGLLLLYLTFRRRPDLGPFWSAPLLFIPLLAQDMFIAINTDVFVFFFGCAVVGAIFRLFDKPLSAGRWAVLTLCVALAMWTKATCGLFFALWPVLAFFLGRATPGRKNRLRITALAVAFFLLAGALGAPWYLYNQQKFGYVFGYIFDGQKGVPYKPFPPAPLKWAKAKEYKNAFILTLLRGEFLWHGLYLDGLPQPWNKIFLEIVFWVIFAGGLAAVFFRVPGSGVGPFYVISAAGFGLVLCLLVLYFGRGGLPFYHARYAFAGLYPILFLFAAGWRRLIPSDKWAVIVPTVLLLGYNASYTARFLSEFLARK